MKTTVDIDDPLLARAKRHARQHGTSLRALIEDGLRRVMVDAGAPPSYELADLSVGDPTAANPLEAWTWSALRDEIYGDR